MKLTKFTLAKTVESIGKNAFNGCKVLKAIGYACGRGGTGMPGIRPEDAQEKLPALVHLTRLGYRYLPLSEALRDRETNILPEELRKAVTRINGRAMPDGRFSDLLAEIRESLQLEDLGKAFYEGLRDSWNGLRLIDFVHPDQNRFHVMTELPYISGRNRFRPDITLFINGLPLAFIELKSKNPRDGIRAEYSRMDTRARNPVFRRFINVTQIMVFSNDEEYNESDLLPTKGAFYAASAYEGLTVHRFREEEREIFSQLAAADPAEVSGILQDNHAETLMTDPDFQASLSPDSPTHRLLTSLFHPCRFLFFLQYGISYVENGTPGASCHVTKQIIRDPQLFAIRYLEHQLRSGHFSAVYPVRRSGRLETAAALIRYMQAYFATVSQPVQYDYLTDSPAQAQILLEALRAQGFRVRKRPRHAEWDATVLREKSREDALVPCVSVYCLSDFSGFTAPMLTSGEAPVRQICFLDGTEGDYTFGESLFMRLRDENPEVFWILFSAE